MSEDNCNKCNDNNEIVVMPPLNCGNESPCVETNSCSEISETTCIVYSGDDIIVNDEVIAENGMFLNEVLENITEITGGDCSECLDNACNITLQPQPETTLGSWIDYAGGFVYDSNTQSYLSQSPIHNVITGFNIQIGLNIDEDFCFYNGTGFSTLNYLKSNTSCLDSLDENLNTYTYIDTPILDLLSCNLIVKINISGVDYYYEFDGLLSSLTKNENVWTGVYSFRVRLINYTPKCVITFSDGTTMDTVPEFVTSVEEGNPNEIVVTTNYSNQNIIPFSTVNGNSLLGGGDIVISTGITIGTTPITSGVNNRILFQSGGVVQQSSRLTYDGSTMYVQASGALPTDKAFLVRNSANTANIVEVSGDMLTKVRNTFQVEHQSYPSGYEISIENFGYENRMYLNHPNASAKIFSNFRSWAYTSTTFKERVIRTSLTIAKEGGDDYGFVTGNQVNFISNVPFYNKGAYPLVEYQGGFNFFNKLNASVATLTENDLSVKITGHNAIAVVNTTDESKVIANQIDNTFQMYAKDIVAGNSAPHFRTENGAIIKIYQETTAITSATLIGGGGTNITDTDTFDGYTLKQIVKALRNQGLLA